MSEQAIRVQIVNRSGHALPQYKTEGSAGMDLYAALDEAIELESLERRLIPSGISIALPRGIEAQVRPRSGLALKRGLSVLNTPGTIDSDYRGEIGVIMINLSRETQRISPGQRIAQIVFSNPVQARWEEVDELDATERGAGGFGSTGTKD